ncbi:hypothetical protein D3C76_1086910 [compost metagenome]
MTELKFTASLKGVQGLHWFTVRDDTHLYVHCDDGDFYDRIKIPLDHEQPALMVKSAVYALEAHARKRRLDALKQIYGRRH